MLLELVVPSICGHCLAIKYVSFSLFMSTLIEQKEKQSFTRNTSLFQFCDDPCISACT